MKISDKVYLIIYKQFEFALEKIKIKQSKNEK